MLHLEITEKVGLEYYPSFSMAPALLQTLDCVSNQLVTHGFVLWMWECGSRFRSESLLKLP